MICLAAQNCHVFFRKIPIASHITQSPLLAYYKYMDIGNSDRTPKGVTQGYCIKHCRVA